MAATFVMGGTRIIELAEADITGLQKTWRVSRLVAELDEKGMASRELGYDHLERLVHRWPGGESFASHGLLDLATFEPRTKPDMRVEDFEALWQEAVEEEEFFAVNDPYGDRFATSMPWWGCAGALAALAAGIYLFIV
ncbi:hypothetical protein GCM10022276_06290 [Sphingomonas limnosediminicola]|uniref:Uncharacterized protein n=1 Tax=Sphingomonas limnosediminicola TaxID=940133 RepID=A0ABP7KY16_9SPHN